MQENGVVTIFRPDPASGRPVCLGTVPAWVNRKHMIRNDKAGVYNDDRFDVRIGLSHFEDVRAGDLVFFGRAESSCVNTAECRRIELVSKNEYGTAPHWHIAAEYKYR